jgi:heat-inducible transcriptional repressor
MDDLTQRQIDILKTIIQEYTETGEPVGSVILEKKYKLGFSPATIRNEMVELAKKGYLKKTHFSSGRVPSAKGFRFYISHLMKEKELSTVDEVAYKNSIWDERTEAHRLLFHATKYLAGKTGLLSITATETGDVYYAGINKIGQAQLLYIAKTLKKRMIDQIVDNIIRKGNESVDRVVYYFSLIVRSHFLLV